MCNTSVSGDGSWQGVWKFENGDLHEVDGLEGNARLRLHRNIFTKKNLKYISFISSWYDMKLRFLKRFLVNFTNKTCTIYF